MTFGYIAGRHAAGATADENNNQTIRAKAPAVGTAFSLAHLTVLDLPPSEVVRVAARTRYDEGDQGRSGRHGRATRPSGNVRHRDPQEASKSSQTKYQLLHLQTRVVIGSSEPPAAIWHVRRLTNPIQ
jgi:hypothetical protein